MATFPLPIEDRFMAAIRALLGRVQRMEQRTLVLDPGCLVVCYTGMIPASYTTGDPTVVITGQSTASGPYQHLTSYTPHANDTVLLIPAGQTYIVAGTYT
ncbi:MAG: hypothetical protein ACRDRN_11845 [Sciscionella sp.]